MRSISKALVATAVFSMFSIALANSTDKTLEEIASYRQWTRVTPKPLVVNFSSFAG